MRPITSPHVIEISSASHPLYHLDAVGHPSRPDLFSRSSWFDEGLIDKICLKLTFPLHGPEIRGPLCHCEASLSNSFNSSLKTGPLVMKTVASRDNHIVFFKAGSLIWMEGVNGVLLKLFCSNCSPFKRKRTNRVFETFETAKPSQSHSLINLL